MKNIPVDILMADDDEIDYLFIKRICKQFNLQMDYVENGKAALERVEKHHYKLLITDIDMPEMDGLTLIENLEAKLLSKRKEMKIAVVSGTSNQYIIDNYKKLGIDYFFQKPASREGIINIFSVLKLI